MIVLLPLRISTSTPIGRRLDQTLATAITRITDSQTAARPTNSPDSPSPPVIATINTTP